MGNLWYNEPKTLDVAFDVIGDIVLSAASQQYGGFTVPSADLILEPYAEKSYAKHLKKYLDLGVEKEKAEREAYRDVEYEFKQGFQGWEYKFNTVASSRGDYPFITVTIGTGTGRFARGGPSKKCWKSEETAREKSVIKNLFYFPRWYFCMMKTFMEREKNWRMFLKRGFAVLQRPCIQTG